MLSSNTPLLLRPTIVYINSSALLNNIKLINSKARSARVLAVVKADGYGHSASLVAPIIQKYVWGFGVATVEEGIRLREQIKKKPILVLGTLWPFDENFEAALRYHLIPTISSVDGVESLSKTAFRMNIRSVPFYLKIDTGMGRIGLKSESPEVEKIFSICGAFARTTTKNIPIRCEGVYTHFSCADFDPEYTALQYKKFSDLKTCLMSKGLNYIPFFSASNSAGLFFYPHFNMDIVRPGISLYGLQPSSVKKVSGLKPVLSWETRVVFLKKIKRGDGVSYARKFQARKTPTIIATLPVGYADGYRRDFTNNADVLIKGQRAPVAGRITMDMTMVDVTNIKGGVSVGDKVVLIGNQLKESITAEELAARADTINYEITCGITSRVPRVELK